MTGFHPPEFDNQLQHLQKTIDRERLARIEAEASANRSHRELTVCKRELLFMESVAAAANQAESLREAIQFALEQVCTYLDWPLGHAWLRSGPASSPHLSSSTLWHSAGFAAPTAFCQATESQRYAPGQGLPGKVYTSRHPLWIARIHDNEPLLAQRQAADSGLRSGFALPVPAGEEVAAVLEFFNTEPGEPEAGLISLLSFVGMQLGRVAERQMARDRAIHDAFHDSLTLLPNRALFLDRLNRALLRSLRDGDDNLAVLFIDADRFKIVNDSLGHLAGDSLIRQLAQRLQQALLSAGENAPQDTAWGEQTLARLGSDEFAILLENIGGATEAVRVAEHILGLLQNTFAIGSQDVYCSASIGIALAAEHQAADELLRDADLAMHRAKRLGGARWDLFDQAMHASAFQRMSVESDMRKSLLENRFVVHYQPVVDLRSGRISGFEALVRWNRYDKGLVFPNDFIPIAEDTGLIIPLDLWVMREACRTLTAWHRDFPHEQPLTISINLSTRLFSLANLAEQVGEILASTGVNPACVRLEITETMAMSDANRALQLLTELRALGVQLSIDDFGTGYSSLNYLHRIPANVLKIDRSFVSQMHESEECMQIIRTIMMLARNLGMKVVAEGPETADHVERLIGLDCDFGQGYFFSRPVAEPAARHLLETAPFART
ncbi:MAG: GGDEF domain-containing protein [Fluviicoccus sp.]|uniref:putative bifunctional diguanylate cyclase/phosphodiesterase n=1 Tax=Fluviicoccus sp. TaxID=2003552 RepID=UPI00271B54EF|nr:GGDEF domain-containing protein [Fluviicoccus sp.]MDO8330999.1 GGDEF domain-containing protein [Fluviicoccus sp.]